MLLLAIVTFAAGSHLQKLDSRKPMTGHFVSSPTQKAYLRKAKANFMSTTCIFKEHGASGGQNGTIRRVTHASRFAGQRDYPEVSGDFPSPFLISRMNDVLANKI